MTFDEFKNELKEIIEKKITSDRKVIFHEVKKNNNIVLTGLLIRDENVNISPTIYLDYYYDRYMSGGKNIENVADEILRIYEKHKIDHNVNFDFFKDYEFISSLLYCKLINYKSNKEFLDDVPHRRFLDLAIVPYCLLDSDDDNSASVVIHKSHVQMWGVEEDDLLEVAMKNTRNDMKTKIMDIRLAIEHIIKNTDTDEKIPEYDSGCMYVVSSNSKTNGAISMTDYETINSFACSHNTDFFVLPSSIHEVLLVPNDVSFDYESLSQMVKDVNESQVSPEEILSDHAYYFAMNRGYIDYCQN